MKTAIVTDSNSGITQAKAKELGIAVVPMPFMIDEKDYLEDINLTQDEFYSMINDAVVVTSQPSVGCIVEMFENTLKEYDEVVYIPMSSGLSQSCQTALFLAKEFEGKVFVVDNHRISESQRYSVLDAIELAKRGKTGAQIKEILEREKFESSLFITVDDLKYLRRGGRITARAAALGKLLKIKPVLQNKGDKFEAFDKARGMKSAKRIMLDAMKKEIQEKYGSIDNFHLSVQYSHNYEDALEFAKVVQQEIPGWEIVTAPLSLSVACHIGPVSLALIGSRKIDYENVD